MFTALESQLVPVFKAGKLRHPIQEYYKGLVHDVSESSETHLRFVPRDPYHVARFGMLPLLMRNIYLSNRL